MHMILMYCYHDTDFYWIIPLTEEVASIWACHSDVLTQSDGECYGSPNL